MKVTRTERGWPAHFICASDCLFRRNTLLTTEDGRHYVVSTVGNYRRQGKLEEIGYKRHYETMSFVAEKQGEYIDSNGVEVYLDSSWAIEVTKQNRDYVDNLADAMHEDCVASLTARLERGEKPEESE